MIELNDKINKKLNDNLIDLKEEYFKSKKDEGFKSFVDKIDLSDDY